MRARLHTLWLWLRLLWAQLWRPAPRPALPTPSRALTREAERCVACGACDRAFTAWDRVPRDRFFGPMHVVLRIAANAPLTELGPEAQALGRGDLEAMGRVCPVDVPFTALHRLIRDSVANVAPPPTDRSVHKDPG